MVMIYSAQSVGVSPVRLRYQRNAFTNRLDLCLHNIKTTISKNLKNPWITYGSLAACFCLIVLTIFVIRTHNTLQNTSQWPVKIVSSVSQPSGEIAALPRWEELSISEQYSQLTFSQQNYYGTITEVSADNLKKSIGHELLSGTDEYTQQEFKKSGIIYSINQISSNCAVAVRFEGNSSFYLYRNSYYHPENLGQLLKDLNLKETIRFGSPYYEHKKRMASIQQ